MTPRQKLAAWLGGVALAAGAATFTATQEGTVFKSYRDPVNILTACAGETKFVATPGDIKPGATFTPDQCTEALYRSLWEHAEPVIRCGGDKLTTGQKLAFLDFTYNVGGFAFCGSTMAAKAKRGDVAGSCGELLRWRMAGGKDCSDRANGCYGVWTRRQQEHALCIGS